MKSNIALLGDYSSHITTEGSLLKKELEDGVDGLPGIFAAGDTVTGPLSIVAAIASGRKAANSIDRFIRGEVVPPEPELPTKRSENAGGTSHFDDLKRQVSHKKVPLEVEHNFDLLAVKFTHHEAMDETEHEMQPQY